MSRQPTFFIPHGGGPCFFMEDPQGTWTGMATFLRSLPERLTERPSAILIVSGHWETSGFAFTGSAEPGLIYDYRGFPAHTYKLAYPVAGAPELARDAAHRLTAQGLKAGADGERGLDHGVFIPLMVAFPDADVPVVQMSLDRGLDPSVHLEAGRALAALRDEGVLIVASGMSFHNMRGYGDPSFTRPSEAFDSWLNDSLSLAGPARAERLLHWEEAPSARVCHPDAEHLLPLMVAAGAAHGQGQRIYSELVLNTAISGFRFD